MNLPKETVRRKVEILKKKKLITYSTKIGLFPTYKVEELMKAFCRKRIIDLSNFLQALKKNKTLEPLLNLK